MEGRFVKVTSCWEVPSHEDHRRDHRMTYQNIKYASLCDGIGAVHVAWQPLGWHCEWTSEIDQFPIAVVDHHWHLPNLGDMTKITEEDLERFDPIDLLVGGTPCQGFSVAGLRGGLDDARSNLALRFCQLVGHLRPRWVLWENVPGVRSSWTGAEPPGDMGVGRRTAGGSETSDFGCFMGALRELGYGLAYRSLDAQYFGLAQRRERVFVVGYFGDWRPAAAVLFERNSLSRNPPPSREAGKGVAPTISARTKGGGGLGTDFDCDGGIVAYRTSGNCGVMKQGDRTAALNCNTDQTQQIIAFPLDMRQCSRGETMTNNRPGGSTGGAPGTGVGEDGDASPSLSTTHTPAVCFQTQIGRNGRGQPSEVASALTTCEGGTHADSKPHVAGSFGVRRLTPKECARLQGFPDDYLDIIHRGKPASDSAKYKALGNSMAVPVMRWIGERIEMVNKIMETET